MLVCVMKLFELPDSISSLALLLSSVSRSLSSINLYVSVATFMFLYSFEDNLSPRRQASSTSIFSSLWCPSTVPHNYSADLPLSLSSLLISDSTISFISPSVGTLIIVSFLIAFRAFSIGGFLSIGAFGSIFLFAGAPGGGEKVGSGSV